MKILRYETFLCFWFIQFINVQINIQIFFIQFIDLKYLSIHKIFFNNLFVLLIFISNFINIIIIYYYFSISIKYFYLLGPRSKLN